MQICCISEGLMDEGHCQITFIVNGFIIINTEIAQFRSIDVDML